MFFFLPGAQRPPRRHLLPVHGRHRRGQAPGRGPPRQAGLLHREHGGGARGGAHRAEEVRQAPPGAGRQQRPHRGRRRRPGDGDPVGHLRLRGHGRAAVHHAAEVHRARGRVRRGAQAAGQGLRVGGGQDRGPARRGDALRAAAQQGRDRGVQEDAGRRCQGGRKGDGRTSFSYISISLYKKNFVFELPRSSTAARSSPTARATLWSPPSSPA